MNPTLYRVSLWLKSPRPYLMLIGFGLFLGFWYLAVEVWKLPRFREMPGITGVIKEWISKDPTYGLSLYTPEYYKHIGMSVWRVTQAFFLATILGVPFGLFLGWSKTFKEYLFPVFETLRPIPILAWVPLAIVMFVATESAVIYLTFLASFYATALNTMLGRRLDRRVLCPCRELSRRKQMAGVPPRDRAGRAAVHLYRAADLGRRVVVLAGSRRNGVGTVRPRLCHQHLVHNGALSHHRHRDDHAGRRRLHHERDGAPRGRLSDAMAAARAGDGRDDSAAGRRRRGARRHPHRRRRQDLRPGRRRGDGSGPLQPRHRGRRNLHDRRPLGLRQDDTVERDCGLPRNHVWHDHARRRDPVLRRAIRRPSRDRTALSCSRTVRCSRGKPISKTSPSAP